MNSRSIRFSLLLAFVAIPNAPVLLATEGGSSVEVGAEPRATDALAKLRAKAESGDATAQNKVGDIYKYGFGVSQNPVEALKWYLKAAEQGSVFAEDSLGQMYLDGEGVTKDPAVALQWYHKAAAQGDEFAPYCLGQIYRDGDGVRKNRVEAEKWYHMASDRGYSSAKTALQSLPSPPADLLRRAQAGDAEAQRNLGSMYQSGNGVEKDNDQAVQWYRKAAEQGDIISIDMLWSIYWTGNGVAKDGAQAVYWSTKGAQMGDEISADCLGMIYENGGNGVFMNKAEAAKWYLLAAERGSLAAESRLGQMYVNGDGVPKDEIEGLARLYIAASVDAQYDVGERMLVRECESRLGREASLVAQQRCKKILKEYETKRGPRSGTKPPSSSVVAKDIPKSSGTGAIVSAGGYVLTAAHVVADAAKITVLTSQGTKDARILRIDEPNDVAVLKIDGGPYAPLPVRSSRYVRLGQPVATIGFPNLEIQGFSPKVTRGEISSLNGIADDPREWQISTPVQPGNSGGPLLDESGNLIGVIEAKLGIKAAQVTGDIPQNVNYALKSAYATALLEPYLDSSAPSPNPANAKQSFEDVVARAQQSVVLILVY